MTMSDPIADMITRIRNAHNAGHPTVEMPASKIKVEIAKVLKEEGYIEDYDVIKAPSFNNVRIKMKYGPGKRKTIAGIKRISKPGLRVYAKNEEIRPVLGGLGIAILSTSQGVMTDREAREKGTGGEIICYVW